MKFDQKELHQIATTLAEAPPARVDLYGPIHKAMRDMLAQAMLSVGRLDCEDAADVGRVRGQVLELLDACNTHLEHENGFVHPAIEARAPGVSLRIAGEHEEHKRALAALRAVTSSLLAPTAAERAAGAAHLYSELALFVAHNYEHMHLEEAAHNAALWDHYSDEELMQIHQSLIASIPPQEMMGILRWMVPAMNPTERLQMLSGMRADAPAEAFAAAIETVRPHLRDDEWNKLAQGLGLRA